jgi:hypothetical protein
MDLWCWILIGTAAWYCAAGFLLNRMTYRTAPASERTLVILVWLFSPAVVLFLIVPMTLLWAVSGGLFKAPWSED